MLPGTQKPCEHLFRDKNHKGCVHCRPRLEYAVARGMLHTEVLEQENNPVIIAMREIVLLKKEKELKICACGLRPVKSKGLCNACYGRARYKTIHKKVRPYKRLNG